MQVSYWQGRQFLYQGRMFRVEVEPVLLQVKISGGDMGKLIGCHPVDWMLIRSRAAKTPNRDKDSRPVLVSGQLLPALKHNISLV